MIPYLVLGQDDLHLVALVLHCAAEGSHHIAQASNLEGKGEERGEGGIEEEYICSIHNPSIL